MKRVRRLGSDAATPYSSQDARPTRVVVVNGSETLEGDTKVAVDVTRALSELGWGVTVITVPGTGADAFAANSSVRVVRTPRLSLRLGRHQWSINLFFASLALQLVRERPTFLYTYDRTRVFPLSALVAIALRIPFVLHMNHFAMITHQRFRYRLIAPRAASIWCVSDFIGGRVRSAGCNKNIRILHNGIETRPEDARPTRAEARALLGIDPGHFAVISVGRLSPFKGQATLIDAFADERLIARGIHCYIVGYDTGEGVYDTPSRPDYHAYLCGKIANSSIEETVHLIGRHPGRTAFAAADLACLVADEEPFGLTTIEAIEAGAPVIGATSGATPEILEDGRTGKLVPPRDHVAVADAIVDLFDHPSQRHELASLATATVLSRFSLDRFRSTVGTLTEELTSRRPDIR